MMTRMVAGEMFSLEAIFFICVWRRRRRRRKSQQRENENEKKKKKNRKIGEEMTK